MAGYSGTPLVKKLGIKPGMRVHVVDAPKTYPELLGELPDQAKLARRMTDGEPIGFAHVFVTARSALEAHVRKLLPRLADDGVIWVSWPKKSAKVVTDVTEDVVREIALPMGLVDVKVCAVDETWSGLKLVIRKENRGANRRRARAG